MGTARTDADEGGEGVRKDRCEEVVVVTRKSVAVALATLAVLRER